MARKRLLDEIAMGIAHWNSVKASLGDLDLSEADFRGAFLPKADFSGCNLRGADFSLANIRGANFAGANIADVNFTGASMSSANFDDMKFSVSEDRRRAVDRKELSAKIIAALKLDLPQRQAKVINAIFDGEGLYSARESKGGSRQFSDIFEHAERSAREIAASGKYSNTFPHIHNAVIRYLHAVNEYHEGGEEVPLGLSGSLMRDEFKASERSLNVDFPELKGSISNLVFTHSLLERFLTEYLALVAEKGLADFVEQPLSEIRYDVEDAANAMVRSNRISNEIPDTLRMILDFSKDPLAKSRDVGFALIRGIEDIFVELLSFLIDLYHKSKGKMVNYGSAVVAASLVVYLANVGGISNMISQNPQILEWVKNALKWLKEVGLLDVVDK